MAKKRKRVRILNLDIDDLSLDEFLRSLDRGIVFTPNVDHMIKLQKDPDFLAAYEVADYRLCDSQILIYASYFLGTPIREKLSGSDVFPAFCEYHRYNEDIRIFLLGAMEGVALRAMEKINQKIGRQIVIAAHSPSFGFEQDEAECEEILELVRQSGATVLAVGVSPPKQEKWVAKYYKRLPSVKIFMCIGATIDFEAGKKMRSPQWMSNLGVEWLYRLLSEPRRLWKRYLVESLPFWWLLLKQKFSRKPAQK